MEAHLLNIPQASQHFHPIHCHHQLQTPSFYHDWHQFNKFSYNLFRSSTSTPSPSIASYSGDSQPMHLITNVLSTDNISESGRNQNTLVIYINNVTDNEKWFLIILMPT